MVSHSLQEEAAWTCTAQKKPGEGCFPSWPQGKPGLCCAVKGRTQRIFFSTIAILHGWAWVHSDPSLSTCLVWFSLPAAALGTPSVSCGRWARQQPYAMAPTVPPCSGTAWLLTPGKLRVLEKPFALFCPPWDKQRSWTVGRLPRKVGRPGKRD